MCDMSTTWRKGMQLWNYAKTDQFGSSKIVSSVALKLLVRQEWVLFSSRWRPMLCRKIHELGVCYRKKIQWVTSNKDITPYIYVYIVILTQPVTIFSAFSPLNNERETRVSVAVRVVHCQVLEGDQTWTWCFRWTMDGDFECRFFILAARKSNRLDWRGSPQAISNSANMHRTPIMFDRFWWWINFGFPLLAVTLKYWNWKWKQAEILKIMKARLQGMWKLEITPNPEHPSSSSSGCGNWEQAEISQN